ncbi:GntR family transcriptional regulator [Thiospirochaeta perfilievii]|uniref:GntR family transcriptional regulator n=1 Tax=Thiospirochaeta perfilievii TaxID=252967 RepID=A0A5C1QCK4_9SPIO|nr:GntR family transcriptional regulator [Thiospirochaeta perfilievii]QEN04396.1 GntR family transcriptional regulator [Thiospirochaeta perfilievii]
MELKYKRVIEYLLNLFNTNSYVSGKQLPTEFEIMDALGVSRNTVRKAILEMEKNDLVERRHGSGTFYTGLDINKKSGGLIGLVNFSDMGYIFPQIIKGVEDTLYDFGYSLVLAGSCYDIEREISSLKLLIDQKVEGLIIDLSKYYTLGEQARVMDLVKSFNIPVVTTHWKGSLNNFSSISINDEKGGFDATNYLISKGHKNIGMVYKSNTQAGLYRFSGYKKALKEAGIEFNEDYVVSYDDFDDSMDTLHAYNCTKDLISKTGGKLTGIFYYTDKCAMEGYKAIESENLTVPDDISVIGFDNYHSSALVTPPLTTFEHPKAELGKWAANVLIDEISKIGLHQPKSLVFEPLLVERKSVINLKKDR